MLRIAHLASSDKGTNLVKSFKKASLCLHSATVAIVLAGLSAPTTVIAQEAPADAAETCCD